MTIRIDVTNGAKEKLEDAHSVSMDPSAGSVVYGVRAQGSASAIVTWVSGTLGGEVTWDSATGRVVHLTPTIGASGAGIELTAGATYELHARLTVGSEVIPRRVAVISAV